MFKDHFSSHSADYAEYRPGYPDALLEFLAGAAPAHDLAWDCGTGNGQVAVPLAARFRRVIATDASTAQIERARTHERVEYRVAPAESAPFLDSASVDLVTCAQALHWFDLDRFFAEVRRVLAPGGVLAAWCYDRVRVSPPVDRVMDRFYSEVVGPYWPPERRLVDAGYRPVALPLEEIEAPALAIRARWDYTRFTGYLMTWSASRRYLADCGRSPLEAVAPALANAWGVPAAERDLAWPLHLRIGRKPGPAGAAGTG